MTWWLGPSILGVVLVGIIMGMMISRLVLRAQKKSLPPFPTSKISTYGVSTGKSFYENTGRTEILTAETESIEGNTVTKPAGNDFNQRSTQPPIKTALNPILLELENNLSIANHSRPNNLKNFHTDAWNSKRTAFNVVNSEILQELKEAYMDMMLANDIVWLVTELGRDSQDLIDSYMKLSNKVGERLQRIMPAIRQSFR